MANPQKQRKFFLVLSSLFKRQSAFGSAMADAALDKRHNCTVTFEDVVERETVYDCSQQDIFSEEKNSQLKRVRVSYATVTAQIIAGWLAYFLSAAAAPVGTPADEQQTVTIDATGGTFTLSFAFEGLAGTTAAIAHNATAATVQAALEALDSIGAGGVSVTKAGSVFTVAFIGRLAKANVAPMTANASALTGGAGTAVVATTVPGTNKFHAISRSTDDALAKFSVGAGFEENLGANPEKFFNMVCESLTVQINKRKNVTLEVTAVGRFTPAEMTAFTVPACENLPALKGRDCRLKINSAFYAEDLWQCGFTLNNNVPVGDDAFPFNGVEVANLERGEKPAQSISMQLLGSRGDAVYALCETETKVPVEILLGVPGERASVIFPNALMKFGTNRTRYVGELSRTAIQVEATPHKDGTILAPVKCEANISQTTAFLTT